MSMNLQVYPLTSFLTEPVITTIAEPQQTDLAVSAASLLTYVVEGVMLLSGGAVLGIAWPDGCRDGVGEIVVDGALTAGNIGANITAPPSAPPGPGSWPATVRATFVTGEEPSGLFAVTLASSDGAEVSVGAGSWIRVWALG